MLLVDDDQPDIGQRREHRQPRPDDDIHLATTDAPPLVRPLPVPEAAMEHSDPGVEIGAEPVHERQCEGDLGHEHQRGAIRGRGSAARSSSRWRSCRHP